MKKSTFKDTNFSMMRSKYGTSKYHDKFESKQLLKLLKLLVITVALSVSAHKSILLSNEVISDRPLNSNQQYIFAQAKQIADDRVTFPGPESQLYYFDNNLDNHFTRRDLSSTTYVKDPNDALQGMGSFISQESFTADIERGVDEFLDVEWKDKD